MLGVRGTKPSVPTRFCRRAREAASCLGSLGCLLGRAEQPGHAGQVCEDAVREEGLEKVGERRT